MKNNNFFQHLDLYVRLSAQIGVRLKNKKFFNILIIRALMRTDRSLI